MMIRSNTVLGQGMWLGSRTPSACVRPEGSMLLAPILPSLQAMNNKTEIGFIFHLTTKDLDSIDLIAVFRYGTRMTWVMCLLMDGLLDPSLFLWKEGSASWSLVALRQAYTKLSSRICRAEYRKTSATRKTSSRDQQSLAESSLVGAQRETTWGWGRTSQRSQKEQNPELMQVQECTSPSSQRVPSQHYVEGCRRMCLPCCPPGASKRGDAKTDGKSQTINHSLLRGMWYADAIASLGLGGTQVASAIW